MGFFVTGTDTDVGKTVAAAWAVLHLNAFYWKPVQCGFEDGTDTEKVASLTGCSERMLPSAYVLEAPQSPHEAARREDVQIDMRKLVPPSADGPIVAEGAGGVLVPLNKDAVIADLIVQLGWPAILVSRTQLGTINHTLLSLEALRSRGISILGVILSGPSEPHNRAAIEDYGHVPIIAELPFFDPLDRNALLSVEPEFNIKERLCGE